MIMKVAVNLEYEDEKKTLPLRAIPEKKTWGGGGGEEGTFFFTQPPMEFNFL